MLLKSVVPTKAPCVVYAPCRAEYSAPFFIDGLRRMVAALVRIGCAQFRTGLQIHRCDSPGSKVYNVGLSETFMLIIAQWFRSCRALRFDRVSVAVELPQHNCTRKTDSMTVSRSCIRAQLYVGFESSLLQVQVRTCASASNVGSVSPVVQGANGDSSPATFRKRSRVSKIKVSMITCFNCLSYYDPKLQVDN